MEQSDTQLSDTQIQDLLKESWPAIKQRIRTDCALTDISYNTWIEPLTLFKYQGDTVYILIPSDNVIQQQYLEMNYVKFFQVTVSEAINLDNVTVVFLLQKDMTAFVAESENTLVNEAPPIYNDAPLIGLNNKYRFDTFVVGGNNNFAYSAALAVAESPGQIYNPLFLYGGPGLGKTHLMHSIGHFIAASSPGKKILYVTSEQFTNEVIESIRSGQKDSRVLTTFREKYRTADVLLLDDVQFIIGKESTQEEFFHTFNALHQAGKQVVISSDRPPRLMETLDERFRSRFEMGLIADIQSPDYETKMAIMQKLAENYTVEIDDAALSYIANNIKSNIRELEGAFTKIIAYARINTLPNITEEMAAQALKDFLHPDLANIVTVEKIIDTVCEHYGMLKTDLLSKKRDAEIVLPRQVVMYLCRKYLSSSNSYKEIGQALDRDHSTVISGVTRIETLLQSDAEFKRSLDVIVKKLNPPF